MRTKSKLTLMERAMKADAESKKRKLIYETKMKIEVVCPFCKALSNAFLIDKHMRISKRCIALKRLFLITMEDPVKTEAKIKLQINDIKRGIYEYVDQKTDTTV